MRIKICYKRVNGVLKRRKIKNQNKKVKIEKKSNGQVPQGLNILSFNVFSVLNDFLEIEDLAALSMTNRKHFWFMEKEQIWADQWEQHFKEKGSGIQLIDNASSFKQKCILTYKLISKFTNNINVN